MSEFTDRLLLLVIAVVGLGSLTVAWFGSFFVGSTSGWVRTAGLVALAVLFVLALVGVWHEFNDIDTEWT